MHIFDTRIKALNYIAEEGGFDRTLRIERAVVPSGEYCCLYGERRFLLRVSNVIN